MALYGKLNFDEAAVGDVGDMLFVRFSGKNPLARLDPFIHTASFCSLAFLCTQREKPVSRGEKQHFYIIFYYITKTKLQRWMPFFFVTLLNFATISD